MKSLFAFVLALALSSCAILPDTISSEAKGPLALIGGNATIAKDLQGAAYNLDQAVAIGVLPANDPAPVCLHDVLVKAGIEIPIGAPAVKSFAPKKDGVASAGAIAYILAQQAKSVKPLEVSVSCEQLVGKIVIDGAKALNKAAPSIPGLILR
jgi:hypothetical protein